MLQTNPNKPGEIDSLQNSIHELFKCKIDGGWNFRRLSAWLEIHPEQLWEAAHAVDGALEMIYPPVESELQLSST